MSPSVNAGLRRKTKSDDAAPATTDDADMNPVAEASLVAADWCRGVESLIFACVRTKDDLLAFGQDQILLEPFLTGLVDGHVLSKAEEHRIQKANRVANIYKGRQFAPRRCMI